MVNLILIETRQTLRQPDDKTSQLAAAQVQAREFNVYVSTFLLLKFYAIGDRRAQFVRSALHHVSGNYLFLRQIAQPPWK